MINQQVWNGKLGSKGGERAVLGWSAVVAERPSPVSLPPSYLPPFAFSSFLSLSLPLQDAFLLPPSLPPQGYPPLGLNRPLLRLHHRVNKQDTNPFPLLHCALSEWCPFASGPWAVPQGTCSPSASRLLPAFYACVMCFCVQDYVLL